MKDLQGSLGLKVISVSARVSHRVWLTVFVLCPS